MNSEVAKILKEIAILLEIEGKDKFKPRAYYRAERSIIDLGEDIQAIAERKELTKIPGIGKGLSALISTYLLTKEVEILESLRASIPVNVLELASIPGVGPKTIALFYNELGITNIESLERALETGKVADLPRMGTKKQEQIADGVKLVRSGIGRTLLADAYPIAESIINQIKLISGVQRVEVTGSFRRRRETIGDLDILVDAKDPSTVMDTFVTLEGVASITAKGKTKSSVRLESNLQIDLRVIPPESFGAGLQYFTGNVDHNVRLRGIARKMGLRLNEYGLYKGDKSIAGHNEDEIYRALGLSLVRPELREDNGEVEAAQKNKLPKLLELADIRGDLHSHTTASDGKNTIEEMLDTVTAKKYDYYCVSDHSQSLTIANGMDEVQLLQRIEEIDEINKSGKWKMKVLKGVEVDILANGDLDIEDEVLSQLDIVTVSIHSRMNDSKKVMTERVCHALENKFVHVLGHPTGRKLLKRAAYEIDLESVFETAKEHNVAMELNASPTRLDLNPGNLRAALRAGLKIVINTDAHRTWELDNMQFGVFQARRGWVTKNDVLNTYPLSKLLKAIKK
ncbi:MAG: DNA polymerase/3'-5' exonuclease PolX [Candidatus Thorarchaeota archaeon]